VNIDINQSNAAFIWLFLLLCYCALIFWLSNQSHVPVPSVFDAQDKLIHASAYAVMAFLFWKAGCGWSGPIDRRCLALSGVVFCSFYGITDEWHQSFVPGRDDSVFDWLADTAGAFLLTIVLYKREFVVLRHN